LNEADLVELSRHATAAQVERITAGWRTVDRNEEALREEERHRRRELTIIQDGDGSYEIRGRVDPEVGAVLLQALKAAEEKLYPDHAARRGVPAHQRRADALGLVAEGALNGGTRAGSRADRFQVVVHVQAGELTEVRTDAVGGEDAGADAGEDAGAAAGVEAGVIADAAPERTIEHGPHVSAETCRRLACDAGRVVMTHDRSGGVLDVGRKTRTVPPAIRRALEHRDGGCRFPGCTNRICDAHHVVHWADGGETKLTNMISACRRHHRLLHEGGYRVEIGPDGEPRFFGPEGRVIPRVPPPPSIPWDVVAVLRSGNEAAGSGIGPWTATPLWHGERLELDYAISVLWRPKPAEPGTEVSGAAIPADPVHVSAET
jgi:hypothetical protein